MKLEHIEGDFGKFACQLFFRNKAIRVHILKKRLINLISSVAVECEAQGGIVGHLKAVLRSPEGLVKASLTDLQRGVDVTEKTEGAVGEETISLLFVVFGLSDQSLKDIVSRNLGLLIGSGNSRSEIMSSEGCNHKENLQTGIGS